jgi:hypothetical protein
MRNWKHWTLVAVIAILGVVVGFTACDNGDGGGNQPEVATYKSIDLVSASWSNEGGSGERWSSGVSVKLSDFTTVKPKDGDVLQFKMSGKPDKKLENFRISLFQMVDNDWNTYTWYGDSSSLVAFEKNFNDFLVIEITVYGTPNPNRTFYIDLLNVTWQKDPNGEYTVGNDSSERFPQNTPDGTVMATISDFSISLLNDEDDPVDPQI